MEELQIDGRAELPLELKNSHSDLVFVLGGSTNHSTLWDAAQIPEFSLTAAGIAVS